MKVEKKYLRGIDNDSVVFCVIYAHEKRITKQKKEGRYNYEKTRHLHMKAGLNQ